MIATIDYGMGNMGSIANMLKQIKAAARLILAGVGAFDAGMQRLGKRNLIPLLADKALKEKVAFLGICLGMQLLAWRSEDGQLSGLGWLDAGSVPRKSQDIQHSLLGSHPALVCSNILEIHCFLFADN